MMYNFDQLPYRVPFNSSKWSRNTRPYQPGDMLPLWVADSDFTSPEPVKEALRAYVDHGVFGYAGVPTELRANIKNWLERKYHWTIDESWLSFPGGVVAGIYAAVRSLTEPGDSIIIQNPVYPPFAAAVKNTGRNLLYNQLIFDGTRYVLDFDHLESLFTSGETKPRMMIFCSPHNASGRVWEQDELERLSALLVKHNCLFISDEIHYDLTWDGKEHITAGRLGDELCQLLIMLSSASKSFNVAGLHASYAVVPNEDLRKTFQGAFTGSTQSSYMGQLALNACYSQGEEYLEQVKAYITKNLDYFIPAINAIGPIHAMRPEGTYLVWVDCRKLGKSQEELIRWFMEDLKIWVNDGITFGPGGEGFVRFNMATPIAMLQEAIERITAGVQAL